MTEDQYNKVLKVLEIEDGHYEQHDDGFGWDSDNECCEISYYRTNHPEFQILSFDEFMNAEQPEKCPSFEAEGKWVIQCHTQEEWNDVLKRFNPEDLDESDFEEHDDGYGIDMDGAHGSIEYYKEDYDDHRIIPASEVISFGAALKNNYSIF